MSHEHHHDELGFDPVAGVLALVLPGLGHFARGDRFRGVMIAIGVLGLFFGGLLIGGMSVVDRSSLRPETRISFIGQAFVGPIALGVNYYHQTKLKVLVQETDRRTNRTIIRRAGPDENPRYRVSVGKMHELGVLAAILAGMLNFIVFLDALMPSLARRRRRRDEPTDRATTTGTIDRVLGTSGTGPTSGSDA